MADRTVVVVAHRMRTVQYADHIIFLADGCVEESGTHEELLRWNGHYARFRTATEPSGQRRRTLLR